MKVQDGLESELQAILMALQHSWSLGHRKVIMESDCLKAIEILTDKKMHFGYYNWKRDILWWTNKFQEVRFQWARRSANKVADKLAKSVENTCLFKFFYYIPLYLTDLLHIDHLQAQ